MGVSAVHMSPWLTPTRSPVNVLASDRRADAALGASGAAGVTLTSNCPWACWSAGIAPSIHSFRVVGEHEVALLGRPMAGEASLVYRFAAGFAVGEFREAPAAG